MNSGAGDGGRGSGGTLRPLPDTEGVLQLELLAALNGFSHGFETRRGTLTEATAGGLARVHQIHGATVVQLPPDAASRRPFFEADPADRPEADALITDAAAITLAVGVADCLPILIADPQRRAVAAVHGGWRGLAAGILGEAIDALGAAFGSDPADLVVGIGPAIGPCCFQVGDEVIDAFAALGYEGTARVPAAGSAGRDPSRPPVGDRPYCDLPALARAMAGERGVAEDHIADAGLCTRCNADWLWSYRADGEAAGRMICGISIGEESDEPR